MSEKFADKRIADESARWNAVLIRDKAADGDFVYAVLSTGIYCRPSCPARRAKRENVVFHENGNAAEAAGFRPCKRCQPDRMTHDAAEDERMALICRMIAASEGIPTLAELAAKAGMSRYHFHRTFKRAVGLTPRGYAVALRAGKVRDALAQRTTVTEAIYEAGYGSNGNFYAESTRLLGMSPDVYRRGAPGETIRHTTGTCSLGTVLVAASKRGVCAILLGDESQPLLADLRRRFPKARLVDGGEDFSRTLDEVIHWVETPGTRPGLPLDIRGTVFQQRVWKALQRIPSGSTRTYADLAKDLGVPDGARAVASACAANPIAVAIPCHRVVRGDGSLAGYRWGLRRKRELLEREAGP